MSDTSDVSAKSKEKPMRYVYTKDKMLDLYSPTFQLHPNLKASAQKFEELIKFLSDHSQEPLVKQEPPVCN